MADRALRPIPARDTGLGQALLTDPCSRRLLKNQRMSVSYAFAPGLWRALQT